MVPMRSPWIPAIRRLVLAALVLPAMAVHAHVPLDGMLLGVTESALQSTLTELRRARKPVVGPNGLRGLWVMQDTTLSGLPFETTFYVKDKLVQRIEQLWTSSETPCQHQPDFSRLIADMASKYGAGLAADDASANEPTQRSMVWEAGAFDVMAHFTQAPGHCAIRVIYKPHVTQDAAEL